MHRRPWIALGALAALPLAVGAGWLLRHLPGLAPPCPLKAWTGLPCLGCGSTRCLMALTQGRWAEAFHWHPALALLAFALPLLAAWDLHRAWRNRPYPELPEQGWLRWAAGLALLAAWGLQVARGI